VAWEKPEMTLHEKTSGASITEIKETLDCLANEDALKIFKSAKYGIASSTETVRELGLTEKRYYARLRALVKAKLLEKVGNKYQHTMFGGLVFEVLFKSLEQFLSNKDRLDLLDRLKKSTSISPMETDEVTAAILKRSSIVGLNDLKGALRPVEIVQTYEELRSALIELIEKAEKEIFIATQYTDSSVAETILNASNRGIKMFFLDGDKTNLSRKMQMLRILLTKPKMMKLFYDTVSSPNIALRYTDLHSSFVVVDEKYAGIEITNPNTKAFVFGVVFQSESICAKLITMFKALWEKAGEDHLKAFYEELKGLRSLV
jgi:hypothetical protein